MTADLSRTVWFKSSYSADKADCVEVAFLNNNAIGVRDSKDRGGPALVFSGGEWDVFVSRIAEGIFG